MAATDFENAPVIDRTKKELCGTLATVKFYDAESGVIIATLRSGEAIKGRVEEGELESGCAYRFLGKWASHWKHGAQFEFSTFVIDTPHTYHGVVKYLEKFADHVGRARALKLWEHFGPKAVETLRTDPDQAAAQGIMPLHEAQEAAKSLQANAAMEKVKIDLHGIFAGRGFPNSLHKACEIKWGARAAEIVRKNPFRLLVEEMPGAGFTRCDKLYLDLKFRKERLKRQMLCIWHELRTDSTGSTWHPVAIAKRAVFKHVGSNLAKTEKAIALGVKAGWLETYTDAAGKLWVAEQQKAENERKIAECVKSLMHCDGATHALWPQLAALDGAGLTEHQLATLKPLLTSPLCILAGSPGTGKTFTAAAVIRYVVDRYGAEAVMVAAPTGKAAVRIAEAMRKYEIPLQATTIHRALKIGRNGHDGKGWGFEHNADKPLDKKFVFIDELSMLDTDLAAALFQACGPGTHVFLIGDPGQLAPVGHGAPQRDLLAAGIPHGILTEIKRNDGLIVQACKAINYGGEFETCAKYDPATGQNLKWYEIHDKAAPSVQLETIQKVIQGVQAGNKFDAVWETQVLCALNTKGNVSREALNVMLQGLLNPLSAEDIDIRKQTPFAHTFRVKDKIICLKNCFLPLQLLAEGYAENCIEAYRNEPGVQAYIANGELGKVLAVTPRTVLVKFSDPDRVIIIPMAAQKEDGEQGAGGESGDKSDFALAYAITTHKSQGSEWPLVLVVVDDAAGTVSSREFVYTAISRASKLCLLIGKKSTLARQCKRVSLNMRKTHLVELVKEALAL